MLKKCALRFIVLFFLAFEVDLLLTIIAPSISYTQIDKMEISVNSECSEPQKYCLCFEHCTQKSGLTVAAIKYRRVPTQYSIPFIIVANHTLFTLLLILNLTRPESSGCRRFEVVLSHSVEKREIYSHRKLFSSN